MSLGGFVKFLVLILHRNGIDLNFLEREHWHGLLLKLKELPAVSGKPNALREAVFIRDRHHLVCHELDSYLLDLCLSGSVVWAKPEFSGHQLDKDVAVGWQKEYELLPEVERIFFEDVVLRCVREEFSLMRTSATAMAISV